MGAILDSRPPAWLSTASLLGGIEPVALALTLRSGKRQSHSAIPRVRNTTRAFPLGRLTVVNAGSA